MNINNNNMENRVIKIDLVEEVKVFKMQVVVEGIEYEAVIEERPGEAELIFLNIDDEEVCDIGEESEKIMEMFYAEINDGKY